MLKGTTFEDKAGLKYQITQELGRGGFCIVYQLERVADGAHFALKVPKDPVTDGNSPDCFVNDALMGIGVVHANVIKYYEVGIFPHEGKSFQYILMEFAPDGSLKDLLEAKRSTQSQYTTEELRAIMRQLTSGMRALNDRMVHRDIKPENILVNGNSLKISDFGLAKATMAWTRRMTFKGWGTYAYMSPEAWSNSPNTIQMDIYSMGVVFYEMATLQHPFGSHFDPNSWMRAHLYNTPQVPSAIRGSLDPQIDRIIMRMLSKQPAHRPSTWAQVEELIAKAEDNNSEFSSYINVALQKIEEKREEEAKMTSEVQHAAIMKQDYRTRVITSIEETLLSPISSMVSEFNRNPLGHKIVFGRADTIDCISCRIGREGGSFVILNFEILHDDEYFQEKYYVDPLGRGEKVQRVFSRPTCNGSKIRTWGSVFAPDNSGFNIIVTDPIAANSSAEWHLLTNTNNALNHNKRRHPEPFAFEFDELRREIHNLGVMHIYQLSLSKFDISAFVKFLLQHVA